MEGAKEVTGSYCSSDDDLSLGPVTIEEIKAALTLRRRTQVLKRTSEDEPPGDICAGKEETWQKLTLPAEMSSCKEHLTQAEKNRSFSVLLDCDVNDD